jgi:hypothetical protein
LISINIIVVTREHGVVLTEPIVEFSQQMNEQQPPTREAGETIIETEL